MSGLLEPPISLTCSTSALKELTVQRGIYARSMTPWLREEGQTNSLDCEQPEGRTQFVSGSDGKAVFRNDRKGPLEGSSGRCL